MLARAARILPLGLRAAPLQQTAAGLQQHFSDLNLSDRETLKKFVGVEDLLGREADARGTLTGLLQQLRGAVAALPADADYRRAIEATVQYRLAVLDANESDAAAEEVLDSHLEELILECREELNLVPIMAGARRGAAPRPPAPQGGGGVGVGAGAGPALAAGAAAAAAALRARARAAKNKPCRPAARPRAGPRRRQALGRAGGLPGARV
jgi:hypothetical protein